MTDHPQHSRQLLRFLALALLVLGGGAVLLDWVLWRTMFVDAPVWVRVALPLVGMCLFVAGLHLRGGALRRLRPEGDE